MVHPCKWLITHHHADYTQFGAFILDEVVREVDKEVLVQRLITIVSDECILGVFDFDDGCIPGVLAEGQVRLVSDCRSP